jgi:hypothetical protein
VTSRSTICFIIGPSLVILHDCALKSSVKVRRQRSGFDPEHSNKTGRPAISCTRILRSILRCRRRHKACPRLLLAEDAQDRGLAANRRCRSAKRQEWCKSSNSRQAVFCSGELRSGAVGPCAEERHRQEAPICHMNEGSAAIRNFLAEISAASLLAATSSVALTQSGTAVPVTVDNYNRAQSGVYFGLTVKMGAFGKFVT